MNNSPEPISPPALTPTGPFKDWPECRSVLDKFDRPLAPEERQSILARIKASTGAKQISFEILWLAMEDKLALDRRWLEEPMIQLLGDGEQDPGLASKAIPSTAADWVRREFEDIRSDDECRQFLISGRHLWVLYAVLKSRGQKQVLVASLTALSECVDRCQLLLAGGNRRKTLQPTSDGQWIAKLVKGRVFSKSEKTRPPSKESRFQPKAKIEFPRAFIEALFAIRATAELSESLQDESNRLHSKIQEVQSALANEKEARLRAEEDSNDHKVELAAALDQLEKVNRELAEERQHSARQSGFGALTKQQTINEVLSQVRRGVVHRLENIRGYADRDNPNREEIVALVGEIERHLIRIEGELNR